MKGEELSGQRGRMVKQKVKSRKKRWVGFPEFFLLFQNFTMRLRSNGFCHYFECLSIRLGERWIGGESVQEFHVFWFFYFFFSGRGGDDEEKGIKNNSELMAKPVSYWRDAISSTKLDKLSGNNRLIMHFHRTPMATWKETVEQRLSLKKWGAKLKKTNGRKKNERKVKHISVRVRVTWVFCVWVLIM